MSVTPGTLIPAEVHTPSMDLGIPDLETADRKIVDEARITHTVKHVPIAACAQPMIKSTFAPATGKKMGKPTTLVLRYLPRQSLGALGLERYAQSDLPVHFRAPIHPGEDGGIVHVKQEHAGEDEERFHSATAPEPEQLPVPIERTSGRERQRRLDQLRLEEIALEKEEIQIRRRMIEDEE